jgi:excisionase family DNA binding protein
VTEIADKLGIGREKVYRLLERGAMPWYKFGGTKHISRNDFQTYLRKCRHLSSVPDTRLEKKNGKKKQKGK